VGSGDAFLVKTPSGRYLLIDGGPSPSRLSDALGRRLPIGQRQLDYWLVAAPGQDNLAALPPVLGRYPPGQVLWAGETHGSRTSRQLQEALVEAQVDVITLQEGQALDLGQGARLSTLAVRRRGAVLLLEWGSFRALLPLGIDFESLEALSADRSLGSISALLLAESGYAPANPPGWIGKLRPEVVLLSVAADDFNGLPSPETLEAVEGYTLLRTDRSGWIKLTTDGAQMWVEVERR
jgi:competence protein ComEC